ncbi:DivIVA domain-containing protein [Arthrobacter sp. APC 3897]|uniref:DivIVA domain-containing protein n=1 Tax=Arthrobacter sp. APC 3897 TaxID=3035204 RepID=UPI0025B484E7|nr:DivIVA domain-containing protein [Arthrobacter sp. APC 3897]MDN3482240.1 DivIVA domain-containing protein [Arthrobacter sp. APC 3897]
MTTFLVFVAVLAAGAVALAATGRPPFRKPGTVPGEPASAGDPGLAEPDPRLPPVLLPEKVQPADLGRLRFSVAFRGYRMDQVDAVLERLEEVLAERDAALASVQTAAQVPPRAGNEERPEPGVTS